MMPQLLPQLDRWQDDTRSTQELYWVGRSVYNYFGEPIPSVGGLITEHEDLDPDHFLAALQFDESETARIAEAVAMLEPWGPTEVLPTENGSGRVYVRGDRRGVQLWKLTQWHVAHREDPEGQPEAFL